MSILNVEHLTHGFGDRAIFNDVSFRLLKGEHIGLVGANGEGKSTFFNIVTGKLMPDEGKIEWAKNVRVGYLDQHSVLSQGMSIRDVLKSAFSYLFEMEERMNGICDSLGTASPEEMDTLMEELGTIQDTLTMHDFYVIDAKVEEVARALGLLDIGLERDVTDLSGGQRTKVLLGKLLLEKPDILLLDEHIEWLKRYLQDYENAFILISHDIPFLNSVINLVYHMENQELNRYVGDYDHFQEVYEVKKAQLEAAYRRQQQEISELKDFVARNKARVSTRNMAMSRQKKLDKMDVIELAAEKPKPEFHFKYGRTPGKYIFETKDLVIGYNEPLSRPVTLSMERGNKIALVGANGIGKTTLLKSILGLIPSLKGSCELGENLQIGYFEQEVKGDNKTTCIDEIWAEFPSYTQYEVRSALAKCGLTTKHIESQVRVLSGGEQAKVRLCKLVNKETNVLLLDEPTNHLDIESIQWLEDFLITSAKAVIVISHDRKFVDNITTRTIEVTMGRIYDYKVNYSQYLVLRKERREQQMKQYEEQQKMIQETKDFIERFKGTYSKTLQVQSRVKMLEKLELVEVDEEDTSALRLKFPPSPRSGNYPVIMDGVGKTYGDHVVFSNASLTIERGDKVAFVGKNGEGKSTLVKCIMKEIEHEGTLTLGHNVQIGYFAQNQASLLDENLTVFQTIDDVAKGEIRNKIRDLLGAFMFGSPEASMKKVKVLSGGERTRLAMIKLLLEPVNLLILDEPTNHLDMKTKDILKQALLDFDGTLIVVSHDRDFLDGLVSKVYEFGNKKVKEHLCGIYEFLETKKMESLQELEKK